jgi:hypothetical protein
MSTEAEVRPLATDESLQYVWRFGYGSNIGLTTLQSKKNLRVQRYLAGTIRGWSLYFVPGFPHFDPGWAAVAPSNNNNDDDDSEVHGSAFLIPRSDAQVLDAQESIYHVVPTTFVSYTGEIITDVGLYVPKKPRTLPDGIPSLRYLRLLRNGAREAGLHESWIQTLDDMPHYVTPPTIRNQTNTWIGEFHDDPTRQNITWTAEHLALHDGKNHPHHPHVSVMGYIVQIHPDTMIVNAWRGHCITRRMILHFHGKSVDNLDVRCGQPGFRPMIRLSTCSEEEIEYLFQILDLFLHSGGIIVARLQEFWEDQDEQ